MTRALLISLIILAIFLVPTVVVTMALLRIHPRRRRLTGTLILFCNLFWLFLPFVLGGRTSPFARVIRAVLSPPWFTWLCFMILELVFLLLVGAIWLLLARRRRPFTEFARRPSAVFLTAQTVFAAVGIYQALVPIRIERVQLDLSGPTSQRPTRIALIGDLHVGLFSRPSRLEEIARRVAAEDTDLVAVAGDFLDDDPFFVPKFLRGLEAISTSLPIVAVLGNHEIYGDPAEVQRRLQGSRVRLLVNEGFALNEIWIAGLSDFAAEQQGPPWLRPDLPKALRGMPAGATPVVLAHQPKAFALARKAGIPLTLVAHTHGGQFGIRPLGWSLAGVFLPYDMGLYREGESWLYVNTGTGYWVVPMRPGMTPEITIIEVR